jgi:hypothetical protein
MRGLFLEADLRGLRLGPAHESFVHPVSRSVVCQMGDLN